MWKFTHKLLANKAICENKAQVSLPSSSVAFCFLLLVQYCVELVLENLKNKKWKSHTAQTARTCQELRRTDENAKGASRNRTGLTCQSLVKNSFERKESHFKTSCFSARAFIQNTQSETTLCLYYFNLQTNKLNLLPDLGFFDCMIHAKANQNNPENCFGNSKNTFEWKTLQKSLETNLIYRVQWNWK